MVVAAHPWETIVQEAARESSLWAEALRPEGERELEPVFSPLAEERYGLGLETIYEGYLLHYGRSRLFAPRDDDTALLLGDYLYAHGLVRVSEAGTVEAVADLAALISRLRAAPRRRASGRRRGLGGDRVDARRRARRRAARGSRTASEPVEHALETHRRRVG